MTRSLADTPLQPGDIVGGRYRVIQAIGDGPLDWIYEAQDVDRHERVVIRVQRRSIASDVQHIRAFQDQARNLRASEADRSIRQVDLGRDDDWGHFAVLSNRENLAIPEVLALMKGVNGYEKPRGAKAPPVPKKPRGAKAPPVGEKPRVSANDFRFPSRKSEVALKPLEPPAAPAAQDRTQPRFAQPRRPKKLEALELDGPRNSRPQPTRLTPPTGGLGNWRRLIQRMGIAVLLLGGLGAGVALYLDRQGGGGTAGLPQDNVDPQDNVAGTMTAKDPAQTVRLVFQVTPSNARLRIGGEFAHGHSIRVPASEVPFKVRFEARGYKSRTIKVVPNRNRTVLVALNRSP